MLADSDTSLGITAEDFYEQQRAKREGPVALGRRLADIISPSTFPPEQWQNGDPLPVINQSVNAYAVNTLASKMMLSAFPPGLPGWRFTPEEQKLDPDIEQDPELYSEITYALARREEVHRARLEATQCRSAYVQYSKLKLITGNACVLWTDIDHPVVYNMHHYVVKREASGVPLVVVLKQSVSRQVADDDVIDAADRHRAERKKPEGNVWDDEIIIYHVQKLINQEGKRKYLYWQEVEGGEVVAGTEAETDFDTPTLYAGGMIPSYGSDWYLPYCSDYEGDLQAVETYASALQDGAAAAARFLTLVDPTGQTRIKDVLEADNLEVIPGREQDVRTLRADKGGDLAVASQEMEKAVRRLGQAFLMFSSVQRSGERVTAEEWRILAQEIDQAMGGLYSQVAQTSQRFFVLRFILLHELSDKSIGKLPEGLVRTTVVTGIDSMSQSTEGSRLREFMAEASEALQNPVTEKYIHVDDYLRRLAAAKNVKAEGLVKDADTRAQADADQQNQAMQQSLMDKATGPAVKGGMDMLSQMMAEGQMPEGLMNNG
ncbi:portal protein [Brucella intermedia]|uniref:portal protein n=1 Tax=Brucella intermedia TaxID=94625 RepID=UPI00224A4C1F|nr:portal protein [Brucella intermedia]